jgi:hypothetical protein
MMAVTKNSDAFNEVEYSRWLLPSPEEASI